MNTGSVILNAVIQALITLGVFGFVGWVIKGVLVRWVERRDKKHDELVREVHELRDGKVRKIEDDFRNHVQLDDDRHRAASGSRKDLHEKFARLDRDKADWDGFKELNDTISASSRDLARMTERVDGVSKRTERMMDRMISVKEDVDRSVARIEGIVERVKQHEDASANRG